MKNTIHAISEEELQAYVDGQLDDARNRIIDEYLAQHPAEAKRLLDYKKNNQLLQALYSNNIDESALRRTQLNFTNFTKPKRSSPLLYAASISWLVIGITLGWSINQYVNPLQSPAVTMSFYQSALTAHAVYSPEILHPVEVTADQEAHLVKWLSKRLDRNIKTPNLAPLGYNLIGGRLLPAQVGPAAQFMYENSVGDRLTLYVIANPDKERDSAFRFFEQEKMKVFYWTDMKMGFAITGDIDKSRLLQAADTIYKELSI